MRSLGGRTSPANDDTRRTGYALSAGAKVGTAGSGSESELILRHRQRQRSLVDGQVHPEVGDIPLVRLVFQRLSEQARFVFEINRL